MPESVARTRKLLTVDERVVKLTEGSPTFRYTLSPADPLNARRSASARRDPPNALLALQEALKR